MYSASPFYSWPANETDGTKGRRKEARRNVRNAMGTSSEPAPSLLAALDAAESLRRIIDMASGGRYGLAIVRPTFDGEAPQVALRETYTFDAFPGVKYTGTTFERASQIHEPVTQTRRRERYLREQERAR